MDRSQKLALFETYLGQHGFPLKGKKMPYASLNGNMFAFLSPEDDLCLRFDADDLAAFQSEFDAPPVLQHGRVMRGYGALADAVLADEALFARWFEKSVSCARALPPKPTKR